MYSTAFRFGSRKQHELRADHFVSGEEKYYADGKLVHSRWSMAPTSTCEFTACGHQIAIHFSMNLKRAQMDAFVDGVLVEQDLLAGFNKKWEERRANRLSRGVWYRALLWACITVVLYFVFRSVGQR